MILILGGTTEGRRVVKVLDQSQQVFYYSTRGSRQELVSAHGIHLTGGMNTYEMKQFCETHAIRLLIDAAHPFAKQLHQTVSEVALALALPVIRFERIYPPRSPAITWCKNYAEAIQKLEEQGITKLLALTGVQTIAALKPYWKQHPDCWFRVLKREESIQLALKDGFPKERICFYGDLEERDLLKALRPEALLTKESGMSGGFQEKIEAAEQEHVPVFAIERPPLPLHFILVDGDWGLRKKIEELLPSFFRLHSGFTTGSCATAASKAALLSLLSQEVQTSCQFTLPNGEVLEMPIEQTQLSTKSATCTVYKKAGDDPDVTNGIAIEAKVTFASSNKEDETAEDICILGGEGVGQVTLPGLGLPIGGPAINVVPQQMIRENLQEVLELNGLNRAHLDVLITVPQGRKIAQRTFNPKLGIVGGISIIGTSGIVQPFSSEAFIQSIKKEIEVAKAIGNSQIVFNSGAKSERFIKGEYPNLPAQAFIHYGNFIGESLKLAAKLSIKKVTLGIMIGKAVKLAEGHLDTHSKKVTFNKAFIYELLQSIGADKETLEKANQLTIVRELWQLIPSDLLDKWVQALLAHCYRVCAPLLPESELTIILIHEQGTCFHAHVERE